MDSLSAHAQTFDAEFIEGAAFIETGDGVVHVVGWSSLTVWGRSMQWLDRHMVGVVVPLTASVMASGVALWATLSLIG
jgi:hypothetical protein